MQVITYKYLPIERISYLKDELLRITQPGDLNDPFECLPVKLGVEEIISTFDQFALEEIAKINKMKVPKSKKSEYRNQLIRKIKAEKTKMVKNEPDNFRDQFHSDANKKLNSKIGILSLSKRWNSTLMWAHYTNSHKGFCIGFDATKPFFKDYNSLTDRKKIFLPVIYGTERIKIPTEHGQKIDPKVMLTKAKDWEYEQEERLLVSFKEATKKIDSRPFDIYLYRVPHELISEIVVGANIEKGLRESIIEFSKGKMIKLFQSKISDTKFDMIREPI